jgi:hypothetical protein
MAPPATSRGYDIRREAAGGGGSRCSPARESLCGMATGLPGVRILGDQDESGHPGRDLRWQ